MMGNNEGSVEATLEQRGSIYGSYENVVNTRCKIMEVLNEHHKLVRGEEMSEFNKIAFGDIVLKLVRATSSPDYPDSYHDLAGYSTLMEDIVKERQ